MSRPAYVYQLDVVWPEGAPRRNPDDWWGGELVDGRGCTCSSCDSFERYGHLPKVRAYLSRRGADDRAGKLRHLGAQVTVQRSRPIEFPEPLTPVDTGAIDDGDD